MPSDETNHLLFMACTTIHLGNGEKTSFWNSAWLQGRCTRDIAPKIYIVSRKKKRTAATALTQNTWIRDLNISTTFSSRHIQEFVELWPLIQNVHLDQDNEDCITWKVTVDGLYSTASAYKAKYELNATQLHLESLCPTKMQVLHVACHLEQNLDKRAPCLEGVDTQPSLRSLATDLRNQRTTPPGWMQIH